MAILRASAVPVEKRWIDPYRDSAALIGASDLEFTMRPRLDLAMTSGLYLRESRVTNPWACKDVEVTNNEME